MEILQFFIFMLLAATLLGVVLFKTSRHSVWFSVGIYVVVMTALLLCNCYSVGYVGGSDPAGNGMEAGFLSAIYFASMILVSIAFLVALALWFFKHRKGARTLRRKNQRPRI